MPLHPLLQRLLTAVRAVQDRVTQVTSALVRSPLIAAAVGVVLLASAAAGCGSGSGSSSTTGALSAAEWRREANAICRVSGLAIRGVRPPRHAPGVPAFVAAVAPLWKQELDSTAALAPPEKMAAAVADYVGALDYLNRRLVEMHIAAERHDNSRLYGAGLVVQDAARDVRLKAQRLRLPACAAQRIP
jgi:hypothetical protein